LTNEHQDAGQSTSVTIYGKTYHLRGSDDSAYLTDLADHVNAKMHEVAEVTGTADTLKVAILTSLNIADEYMQTSSGSRRATNPADNKRLAKMVTMLGESLAG
jgi:cell division protein ZapA